MRKFILFGLFITSTALMGILNAKVPGEGGGPRCATAGADETNNGVCYNVYGEDGQVIGSNCTQPDPGSSAIKNCIFGTAD